MIDNIIELAELIDTSLQHAIEENDGYNLNYPLDQLEFYDKCIHKTVGDVMREIGGHISPTFVKQLVTLHRKPWNDINVCIPC